jgi:hypothetical protein
MQNIHTFHNLLPYYLGSLEESTTNTSSRSIVIFIINDKRQREELNGIAIQREALSNSMTG